MITKINCKTLLIHSEADETSLIYNYDYLKKYINPKIITSLIVKESHHNIFDCDVEKDIIQKIRIKGKVILTKLGKRKLDKIIISIYFT